MRKIIKENIILADCVHALLHSEIESKLIGKELTSELYSFISYALLNSSKAFLSNEKSYEPDPELVKNMQKLYSKYGFSDFTDHDVVGGIINNFIENNFQHITIHDLDSGEHENHYYIDDEKLDSLSFSEKLILMCIV